MPDPIIDRDAIIEKAARVIHGADCCEMADLRPEVDDARRAIPVIADDLLAPIEALHQPVNRGRVTSCCSCEEDVETDTEACVDWPCPTAQAVAAIREAVWA